MSRLRQSQPIAGENIERITIRMPELFVSFLKDAPLLNAEYTEVKYEAEEAITRECSLSTRVSKAIMKCDWAYLAAIVAHNADRDRYRTLCDWGNWVFPFDDLFDDGELRADYESAKTTMDQLLGPFVENVSMCGRQVAQRPSLLRFHDGLVHRIQGAASKGAYARYLKGMVDYCNGTLEQVQKVQDDNVPAIEEFLAMRRRSVCVSALFALIEYVHNLDIPDYVFENAAIREIEEAGIDIILMHNDLLSYYKEESERVPHNLVAVARMSGMTGQEAVSFIGSSIDKRYSDLRKAASLVPLWGTPVTAEVEKYIQGIRNVIKANLYWSFGSHRYLSEEQKKRWRSRGEIEVLANPQYLVSLSI
ncbi:terpenoid synthase [Pseudovirgaria hyperparasitica]|uniref:Terpene synthase n=1 Tax=Pseudovirgaria hyperparasitica TaxID=470096 RepID=A0A6A6WIP0_9PEZI|nr:terpenoid synthase [Pseudovirgaria hyperparasitica]KAF2761567.1 terpenoid synthase [Pseudovirgaria hyperparasitica]